ncbi:MAG: NUDIX domain-containing protein [Tannerella sp.]|jgi:ADP-ribose pyrophosphatase YjhB (NUDIX family)|nr:NUDIX domain-containing protein [Tannerella sp.]
MSLFYKSEKKFYVSVDCIILGFKNSKLYLLLIKRKFQPLKGQESLMGGFIHPDENIEDTVHRTLYEYTGIDGVYMEQVGAYGQIGRDTGERVISIAYYALINMALFDEMLCRKHHARWVPLDEVGPLVFDHNRIVEDTIDRLQRKAAIKPIGFNLLPEKFTLPQLQALYEAIYAKPFDKRNFRKRMLDMGILEKQEDKDKTSSKRGAYFYRFNKDKYDELLRPGSFFALPD